MLQHQHAHCSHGQEGFLPCGLWCWWGRGEAGRESRAGQGRRWCTAVYHGSCHWMRLNPVTIKTCAGHCCLHRLFGSSEEHKSWRRERERPRPRRAGLAGSSETGGNAKMTLPLHAQGARIAEVLCWSTTPWKRKIMQFWHTLNQRELWSRGNQKCKAREVARLAAKRKGPGPCPVQILPPAERDHREVPRIHFKRQLNGIGEREKLVDTCC
jgi:hypothetical protein